MAMQTKSLPHGSDLTRYLLDMIYLVFSILFMASGYKRLHRSGLIWKERGFTFSDINLRMNHPGPVTLASCFSHLMSESASLSTSRHDPLHCRLPLFTCLISRLAYSCGLTTTLLL